MLKHYSHLLCIPVLALVLSGACGADPAEVEVAGSLGFRIEVGSLTVIDTYSKPEFTRVNFTQEFSEPPLVFTLPTIDGSNAAAHRIRNIDRNGFDIMTLEPDGEDGPHIAMALNFLAVEEGIHSLPGGRKLVAGRISTRRYQAYGGGTGWETVDFGDAFSTAPAVLGQIQGMVNEQETRLPTKPSRPWLTTAIHGVTAAGMQIALERSDSPAGSVDAAETIAYLAAEPAARIRFSDGGGQVVDMEIIRSDEVLQGWGSCNANPIRFSRTWPRVPVVLATKNTRGGDDAGGGGDGGWLRRCSTSTDQVRLQIDEVRSTSIGDGDRQHMVRERAAVILFSGNFVIDARELDHFRLMHDGFGIAGIGERVTIKACRDADCASLYTDTITVTLGPANSNTNWSGTGVLANQVTFDGGTHSVILNRRTAGTLNLAIAGTPTPKNGTRCFVGSAETCRITIAGTGFSFTLPDQVAGLSSVGTLSLPTCWDDFRSTTHDIALSARYLDPAESGPAVRINDTALPTDGSPANVALTFDDECRATLSVGYPDVGQLGLAATFTGSGDLDGLVVNGSDTLVFYPASLVASAINAEGLELNASAADAGPTQVAGVPFTLRIHAVNAAGDVVTRYQPQSPQRLKAYLQRTGPVSGFDGDLSLSDAVELGSLAAAPVDAGQYVATGIPSASFVDGVFSDSAAQYSEVGLVRLHLMDSDYFGHQVTGTALDVGRFIPAALQTSGNLVHRAQTPGCAGGGFSYLGEVMQLGVELTAVNASGAVTRNYAGAFAHLDGSGFSHFGGGGTNTLAAQTDLLALHGRLQIDSAVFSLPWMAGLATLDLEFSIAAGASPDGPHDPVTFGLALSDADGVGVLSPGLDASGDGSDDHAVVGSGRLLQGRLAIGNAHGSELMALDMPLVMQFYAGPGAGFITHGDDNCTPIGSLLIEDADGGDALAVDHSCIVDPAGSSGANACPPGTSGTAFRGTSLAGGYSASLRAPGAGRSGALRVRVDAPAWAEFNWAGSGDVDPVGTATFGIHNRDVGVVYQRDVR
jgi:MSHA biogenesis protein MshQ